MSVRVGVIGVGAIGQEHIRRLTRVVAGAQVVAISDMDRARAEQVASSLDGVRVVPTGQALIAAPDVDAVLVATWGPSHAEFVLAAIAAGKPVFCEKPLAPTAEECLRILDAETSHGRRLVQVGFMRRYDAAYRALKRALSDAALGAVLLVHCAHRNAEVPPHYRGFMPITDTAIHEIDIVRWLLDDEIVAARVLRPRRSSGAPADLQDPVLVILEMASGALVDLEVYVSLPYGYEIRCEVVGELGTAALGDASPLVLRQRGLRSASVARDFQERFGRAYETELQAWLDSVQAGSARGPSAWDGYAATAGADACIAAWQSGERAAVQLRERPALYADADAPPDRSVRVRAG